MNLIAQDHKLRGNERFSVLDFQGAIDEYTKAIIKDPTNPKFFTNRALCYLKLEDSSLWEQIVADCRKALELEPENIKALFYQGQAQCLQNTPQSLARALTSLKRAYDLAITDRSISFTFDICKTYLATKKAQWIYKDQQRRIQNSNLVEYLYDLLEKNEMDSEKRIEIKTQLDSLLEASNRESEKPRIVPDQFVGKIHFEIMTDPVITPSGVTFDRIEIKEHLSKIGRFDPFTREALDFKDLIPNLALKETIDEYLEQNGWAVDY